MLSGASPIDTLWTVRTWLLVIYGLYSQKERAAAGMKATRGLRTYSPVDLDEQRDYSLQCLNETSVMKTPIKIHYFKKDQRLEFTCPFCNQSQRWLESVRVESDDAVHPDPATSFRRHTLGSSDGSDVCLVKPSIDEIEEYAPVAKIEP